MSYFQLPECISIPKFNSLNNYYVPYDSIASNINERLKELSKENSIDSLCVDLELCSNDDDKHQMLNNFSSNLKDYRDTFNDKYYGSNAICSGSYWLFRYSP